MKKKLLALYSLKFNPFCADIPTSALFPTPASESTSPGESGWWMTGRPFRLVPPVESRSKITKRPPTARS